MGKKNRKKYFRMSPAELFTNHAKFYTTQSSTKRTARVFQNESREDSAQTARMHRVICIFAGC